jgi:hypothetical protein
VPPRKKSSAKAQGIFHGLSEVIREAIVTVAMKDAPSTRKKNNDAIQLQATAQRMKVELLKEKNLECATEAYIDGLYYYQMYFSPACWKDDRRVMAKHLKKITSDTAKYNARYPQVSILGIRNSHVEPVSLTLAKLAYAQWRGINDCCHSHSSCTHRDEMS